MKNFNYRETGCSMMGETLYNSVLRGLGFSNEEQMNLLLGATKDDLISWQKLNLINEGADLVIKACEEEWVIGLVPDCDNDGMASSAEFYRYIKRVYPNADIRILHHTGKQHGLSSDIKVPKDIQLLVLPDAGTNDIEAQRGLVAKGVKILNIDHHQLSGDWEEVEGVITINSQNSPLYPNKSISGSGVTYKFLQALDFKLGLNYADDYRDLAGMGCLADSMECTEIDTRYLMNCSVNMDIIKNPYLKKLIEEKILKMGKLNLTTLAWNVIPNINSAMRLGTMEEREAVFNAFISDDEEVVTLGVKKATACKSRQDRLKKKALIACHSYISERGLSQYPIIALNVTDLFEDNGLNGVVANSLSSDYNRPILLISGKNEIVRGSCRNANETLLPNFRQWCIDSELFEMAEGHDNAFGVEIKAENIDKVIQLGVEKLGLSKETEKVHKVERVINFSDLSKKDVLAIGGLEDLWATNLKEPVFLVKGVRINSSKVERVGSRKNVLRFVVGDFSFMKMFLSGEFYDRITLKDKKAFGSINLKMDVLCKFKKNEWESKVNPQLEVVDIHSEVDEVSLDDIF